MIKGVGLSVLILGIFITFYIIDFYLIHRFDKLRDGSGRNWRYTAFMMIGMIVVMAQPAILPQLTLNITLFIQIFGLVLLLLGLALQLWSRLHLGKHYIEHVKILDDHTLVRSGPYSRVRHPVFTSFFISVFGLLFINPSPIVLLVVVYTFWDFARAAKKEEELLSNNIEGYKTYMMETSRFLPKISNTAI